MIDERELIDLLAEAANDFEVPADGPATILAAATTEHEPAASERWWETLQMHRVAVACAVVIVVVSATVATRQLTGAGSSQKKTAQIGRASAGPARDFASAGDQGSASVGGGAAAQGTGGGASPVPAPGSAGSAGQGAVPQLLAPTPGAVLPTAPPARDSAKVVKTGSVSLEVARQGVAPTMTRLGSMATGLGGYVADTKTAEGGEDPSGSVTLRVPVDTFEQLLGQVRALGTVKSSTTHGQDVTAQYADVQARLTALSATRDQLLTILHRASAIGDILAVQDRLNDVQTQIDQLQGQQKVLDDQTSMASLSVDVAPKGATPNKPSTPSGIGKAWDDARHGFTSGVEDILAASGTILVVLLVLAALAALARFGWLALRRRTL